jgi:bifunctional non-homologous end joining protein LigD
VPLSFIEPQLATLTADPPAGDEWHHELKYDGYRVQLIFDAHGARAFTRNGHDWSDRFPFVLAAVRELRCSSAILDGEMIVQDEQGRSDFDAFKRALGCHPAALIFMAFDLLHLDGRDLRPERLEVRRAGLRDLVGCHDPACRIQFSDHVDGDGAALFAAAERTGLEGIVSKRRGSRYRSGRSRDWLKVKCWTEGEFVVVGVETGRNGPPAALLARSEPGGLVYAGSAFVTLPEPLRDRFWQLIEALAIDSPTLPMKAGPGVRWVRPELRVKARHLRGAGKIRHATLTGLVK